MKKASANFDLAPINTKDFETCLSFRQDSYISSFGNDNSFVGREKYLEWLSRKMREFPGSCQHLWLNGEIVGQFETGRAPDVPYEGKIYLVYVAPRFRSMGYGSVLLTKAEAFLLKNDCVRLTLRVSPTNTKAVDFYKSKGWLVIGEDVDEQKLIGMKKILNS